MTAPDPRVARALRWYARLLRLYPAAHRRAFGDQMRQTFADYYRDRLVRGGRVGAAFWLGVAEDEARAVAVEWRAARREGMMTRPRAMWWWAAILLLVVAFVAGGRLTVMPVAAVVLLAALALAARRVAALARSRRLGWRPVLVAGLLAIPVFLFARAQVQGATTNTHCTAPHATALQPPATLATAADYLAQGDYDFDRGECARAVADYRQAIALDPQYAEAYNNRAYAFMMEEDYARALPDLDRAIQLRPGYVHALMNRGDIYNYYYAIDRQKAIADYDRVIAQGRAAYRDTSVCGHRWLALHDGWHLSTLAVFVQGPDAGCH